MTTVDMNMKFVFREKLKISQTVEDMVAYAKLDDTLFHRILYSTDDNLQESRRILERIHKRELYKCIGQTKPVESETFARSVRKYTYSWQIFRWFKFTLKPPNSMARGNFFLAIWDTSHWNFFVKFGLKTPYDIS